MKFIFFEKHPGIKKYQIPILVAIFFIVTISGVLLFGAVKNGDHDIFLRSTKETNTLVDTTGKQVIELNVKGNGYSPNELTAKAGEPIVLRAVSKKALGCASIVALPDLKIRRNLPINGITDIEIPAQTSGTTVHGTCIMGMYSFDIKIISPTI